MKGLSCSVTGSTRTVWGPFYEIIASMELTYHPDNAPASLFSLVEWTHAHCDFHTHPFFN